MMFIYDLYHSEEIMAPRKVLVQCAAAFLSVGASFTLVHAQGGAIVVSIDRSLASCDIVDSGALVEVYIGHSLFYEGNTGARFRLDLGGVEWTLLQTRSLYWTTGDPLTGITVCYESCVTNPVVILELLFWGSLAPECSVIRIAGHPVDGHIWGLDCESNMVPASGFQAVVNPTSQCWCTVGNESTAVEQSAKRVPANFCAVVPVEDTTWGTIKALYR